MTAEMLWQEYVKKEAPNTEKYEAWAFGGAPDKLAKLTVKGIKTATSSAYPLYELEREPLPQAGDYSVILDSHREARCVIQTAKVYLCRFCDVSSEHAAKEGEGDRSLAYWRKVHREFFTDCLRERNLVFSEDMLVVCEEFICVYPKNDR